MDKIEECLKTSKGQPTVYASTTKGTVKLVYEGHHFRYSFRKGKYSIFQCCYKENREECKMRVFTDQKNAYVLDGEHIHFVHAVDKSVTSVKFTTGSSFDIVDIDDVAMVGAESLTDSKAVELIGAAKDPEEAQEAFVNIDNEEAVEKAIVEELSKLMGENTTKIPAATSRKDDTLTSTKDIINEDTPLSSNGDKATASLASSSTSQSSEKQQEDPELLAEDPKDFRAKIKKRLQKALLGKTKL